MLLPAFEAALSVDPWEGCLPVHGVPFIPEPDHDAASVLSSVHLQKFDRAFSDIPNLLNLLRKLRQLMYFSHQEAMSLNTFLLSHLIRYAPHKKCTS